MGIMVLYNMHKGTMDELIKHPPPIQEGASKNKIIALDTTRASIQLYMTLILSPKTESDVPQDTDHGTWITDHGTRKDNVQFLVWPIHRTFARQ